MEYQQYQAMPGYWNESVLKPRPFYYTDFDKSIEKIVLDEPEEPKGLADKIFSDKSKTLKSTIKALFNEINVRERLDSFLLYRINEDICRQHSYLEQAKNLTRFSYSVDFLGYFNKAKMQIENNVLELEKEKRKEYLECWKDLMGLKKELLSALKDYWLISKRRNVLTYNLNKFAEEDEDD
jgi:hypothetical protein